MRKKRIPLLFLVTAFLCLSAAEAAGQEFTTVKSKRYVYDAYGQPWADLDCRYTVKLYPEVNPELAGRDEVSVQKDGREVKFTTGTPVAYRLQQDAQGTYAEVDFVVFNDANKAIVYQQGIWNPTTKREVSNIRKDGARLEMRNDRKATTGGATTLGVGNATGVVFKQKWWIILGSLLLGAVIVWFLIFRWLFSGLLLRRKWGVSSAQNFTRSLAALVMLGILVVLSVVYLGLRVETYAIIGLTGALLILTCAVWLVSGSKHA